MSAAKSPRNPHSGVSFEFCLHNRADAGSFNGQGEPPPISIFADFDSILVAASVAAQRVVGADVHDVRVVHAVEETGVGQQGGLVSTQDQGAVKL